MINEATQPSSVSLLGCVVHFSIGNLRYHDADGHENVALKVNLRSFNLYPYYSNSFTGKRTLFEPTSQEPYSSSEKERKFSRRLFTSSLKREIRRFPVVAVQWRQRNVPNCVMHGQSCCFAHSTFAFLTFSLSSLSWHLKVSYSPWNLKLLANDKITALCQTKLSPKHIISNVTNFKNEFWKSVRRTRSQKQQLRPF